MSMAATPRSCSFVVAERVGGEEAVDIGDGEVERVLRVGDELVLLGDLDEPVVACWL
jgi:hypothetical protein